MKVTKIDGAGTAFKARQVEKTFLAFNSYRYERWLQYGKPYLCN